MISGMYLGEIARVVCLDLIERKLLFNGRVGKFATKDSFLTKFVSEIERQVLVQENFLHYQFS